MGQFLEKQRCKSTKNPQFGKDNRGENAAKPEILSFCQFFSFGIKIDKMRGVAKCSLD